MLLIKNILDWILALFLLLLMFPFLLVIILWLWIGLNENPFFVQERVGKNGKHFRIVKLKTIADKRGPKMQQIQMLLRTTHVDELPQLLNVLAGSMSLVGPRPHTPEHAAQYQPWQRKRLMVKPGITCLRQLKSPHQKLEFNESIEDDIEYVDSWSLGLDLKILVKTFVVAIKMVFCKR